MPKSKDLIKIKATDDIEINGTIYFIPDKYIENKFLSYEYKKLYKLIKIGLKASGKSISFVSFTA